MTTTPHKSAPAQASTHPSTPVHGWPRHDRRLRIIDAATSCPVGRTKLARYLWEQAEALMHPFTPVQPQKVAALDELMRRLSELRAQEDIMEAPRPSIWNFPWPRKFHTFDAEMNWRRYTSQEKEIQARAASARVQASTLHAIVEAASTTATPNHEDDSND